MIRLTSRTPAGVANLDYPQNCFYPDGTKDQVAVSAYRQKAIDRLAAYEDTGLEAGETLFFERSDLYAELGPIEHLRELAKAEKDGRLVVLPCKVTDTVYLIESILKGKKVTGEQVVSALIDHVTIGGTVGKPVFDICSATDNWYMALDPGEFFLTREEAEAALAKEGEKSK